MDITAPPRKGKPLDTATLVALREAIDREGLRQITLRIGGPGAKAIAHAAAGGDVHESTRVLIGAAIGR